MYQPISTSLRPSTFEEVIGQDIVVESLRSILKSNKLANGFIFSGQRGLGKTTLARIFARGLNCNNLTSEGNPCNECSNCKLSLSGKHPDIIELDAISNGKVDDIRGLLDNATKYPISGSKYKIFIVDEAQGLSVSINAWDTLLKELEERKPHVFWIFCTTQKNKIPLTIRSRLLCFDLRLIPTNTISNYLSTLSYFKDRQVEPRVYDLLALRSNNSLRDALTLVETYSPYLDVEGWSYDKLITISGTFDVSLQIDMFNKILDQDVIGLWSLIEQAIDSGLDLTQLFDSLINLINFLMAMATGNSDIWLEYKVDDAFDLYEKVEKLGIEKLINISNVIINRKRDFDSFDNKKFVLQTMALELCTS
jgi:DNA polymerase-3 subunit gamma/tau